MAGINRELAAQLAVVEPPIQKECWRNAVLALAAYRGDLPAFYVEGALFIWHGMLLIDHGWVEIDQQIVDTTLDDCQAEDYHPITRYSLAEVQKKVGRRTTLPFYMRTKAGRAHFSQVAMELLGVPPVQVVEE